MEKDYIAPLSKSFRELNISSKKWNEHTENFFEQELDRLLVNATYCMKQLIKLDKRVKGVKKQI